MHQGLLTRNGEYAYLDRRYFDDLPTERFCRLADCDVGSLIISAEPALSKLEEHGALSQWLLQRLNHLSGGTLIVNLDEDLAGWFTLDVLVVRDGELIALLEFDGSDLHIDCTLHGDELRACTEALHMFVRACIREFHNVQELQDQSELVEEDW